MLQEPILHLSSEKENLNSAFLPTITHPKKKTDKSNTEDTKSFHKASTQDKKMPGISTLPRTHGHFRSGSTNTDSVFVRPNSQVSCKARAADEPMLKKSSSYQNIKIANSGKSQTSMHLSNLQATTQSKKRNMNSKQKHHGSVANIPTVCSKNTELTSSEPHFQTHLNTQSNAHRISVNSDLLSRVEREKKQYEARISELTQVTETRKMEIEKLTFEVRRAKEEASKALLLVEDAKLENAQLRNQLLALGSPCKKDGDQGCTVETHQNPKQNSINPNSRKPFTYTSSPPESLGTTTRLTPGGATTVLTGAVTASSRSSEWNDTATGFDLCSAEDSVTYSANYPGDLESLRGNRSQSENAVVSVATLQGRLLQMEEANYTTNEELQATLQELWDLQRSLDEAHEEAHSLAFERAILLEALATQTSKLEHCRFQIEQLKHLLLTDRSAQTLGTRENHFCELYASIEQEKQVLLGQNNDLAQSSESLARECRILTEKASALQDSYDALEAEHHSLEKVYQSVFSELNSLKCKVSTECHRCSVSKQDDASSQLKEVSVAIQTDSFFFTDSVRSQQSPSINENQKKFNEITSELHKIKEKYEILLCDREREQTEWRLYERDLLKAVQVADGIKTESELESRRLNSENSSLKEQVEKLTKESNQLNSEIRLLKEKINLLSSKKSDTEHSVVDNHQSSRLDKQCIGSASFPSSVTNQSVLSTNAQNVCANGSTTSTTSSSAYLTTHNTSSSSSCRLPPGAITDSTYPGRSSIMHSYSTHRPSGFNHTSHLHPTYPGSPGAPGRPSALSTGPTVRSLIQSIENQVKAVQHQKRSTSSVSVNNTRPVRLYTNSTNNGTTNNRQNVSQCLTLMSPIGYPGKSNNTSIGGAGGGGGAAGGVGVNGNSSGTNSSSSSNNGGSNNVVGSMATLKSRTTITDPVIPSEINHKIKNQENTDLNLMHSSAPGGPSSTILSSTNQNSMKKYPIDNNQRNLKTPLGTSTIMNSTGTTVFTNLNQFTKTDSKDVLLRRNNSICGPNVKNNVVANTVTESSNSTASGVHQSLNADTPSNTLLTNTNGSFDKNKNESPMHNKESPPRKLELISLRRFTSPTITDNNKSKVNHTTTHLNENVNPYLNETDISPNSLNENLLSVEASNDHSNTSTSFHSSIHQVWQDPLQELARLTGAGSKRNALLRWCQSRVLGYPGVEVTNFSSSWNNGLAFCALLHTYVPSKIPWNDLVTSNGLPVDKRRCFETAFKVAENEGIPTTLQLQDMLTTERPDWSSIMTYITSIYRHYEVEALNPSSPTGTSTGIP